MRDILDQWLEAKHKEAEAIADRREIEDKLTESFKLDEMHEGSSTIDSDGYKIKITQRLNKKVDSEMLQEIAAQEGLADHLPNLFKWKPEINKKEWDSADESITAPLSMAITMKAGRPSYNILKEI